jgi:UDP-GlcNAc:undecaprenyl-phosphate GlcNAc-1-phosphate transferase
MVGLMDEPRADRWHRRAVPRLGGIAIYLDFTLPLLIWKGVSVHALTPLLAGGAAIFLVGLIDDLARLENRPKLVLLIICAVLPVMLNVRFTMLPPFIGVPLAIFWILGATNAFNWLDNMDGVAAGVAAIASVYLFVLALLTGSAEFAQLPQLLAGATLGFLLHNFPPARIFMGDCGSGFIGLTLATLALMGSYRDVSNVLMTVFVPGLILAVPIFDSALVTLQRLMNGRRVFQGGRDHPAHRLVSLGLPERKAVFMLYGLSFGAGIAALAASSLSFAVAMSFTGILLLGFVVLGLVLSEIHVYEGPPIRNGVTLLPRSFANKKWIFVMLLDVALVSAAYVVAHLLRYDGRVPPQGATAVIRTLPFVVAAKMVGLHVTGVYKGPWRYASGVDVIRLGQGVTAGSVLAAAGLVLWTRLEGLSRSALILDWMLTLLVLAASRLSVKLLREYLAAQAETGRRVLIFGADGRGISLARMLRENPSLGYHPVGFIDDDPSRRGTVVYGLTILGGRQDIEKLIRQQRVEEVLLAAQSCPRGVVDELIAACNGSGVQVKKMEFVLKPETLKS